MPTGSPAPKIDDGLLDRVIAASEGNPLLAEEAARSVAAGGLTAPNLRTAVRATVRGLDSPARDLPRLLAVAGRPLQPKETAGLGIDGVGRAVEAAVETGLVVDGPDGLGFRHAMLREAVYADLDGTRTLHNRFARRSTAPTRRSSHTISHCPGDPAKLPHRGRRPLRTPARSARCRRQLTFSAGQRSWTRTTATGGRNSPRYMPGRANGTRWPRPSPGRSNYSPATNWPKRGAGKAGSSARWSAIQVRPSRRTSKRPPIWRGTGADTQAAVLIGIAWGEAVDGDVAVVDDLLGRARELLPADPDDETLSDIGEIRLLRLIRQGRFAECGDAARDAAASASRAFRPDRGFAIWLHGACAEACAGNLTGALDLADLAVESTTAIPVLLIGCLGARAHLLARLGRLPRPPTASPRNSGAPSESTNPGC